MRFFYLSEAVRSQETGDQHPQIMTMSKLPDYMDDNGIYVFSRVPLPQTAPNLKYLLLDKKANVTDVLSCAMLRIKGFLMNEKFRTVVKDFKLPEHEYYPAFVKDSSDRVFNYYWLQMVIDYTRKHIDFERSKFEISTGSMIRRTSSPVEINSLAQFNEVKATLKKDQSIHLTDAVLNEVYKEERLDMFNLPDLSGSWIITEDLKEAIIKSKISGIQIKPADNVKV